MNISKACKKDIKKLFEIENEVFKNDPMAISLNSFYYHIKKGFLFKIKIEKNVVVYILWLERKKYFRLYSLAILNDFTNKGLASKLIAFSLKNLDKNIFQLEVRMSNIKAIKLYEKIGFEKIKILKNYYKNEDGVLMKLE